MSSLTFQRQTEELRQKFYEKKVATADGKGKYLPLSEGVALIRRGLYAFYFETGAGYKLISETFNEDEKCGLVEMGFLQMIDPYYVVQKNSTYKELIKIG